MLATASQPSADRIVVTYYGGPDHNSIESITVRVNGLQVDDDADSGNTSAIAGVGTGYTLTISNNSNMTANNGKHEPEWRQGSLTAPNGPPSTRMCDPAAVAKPLTPISLIPEVQIIPVFAGSASCFQPTRRK